MARILPKTTQLKKRARFILEPVYRLGCSRQVAFPSYTGIAAQYLAALPADRRAALSAVRMTINENLPDGYEEGMQFGMIGWYVPLSLYPAGDGDSN